MEYKFIKKRSGYAYNGDIHIAIGEYGNLTESERDFILSDILEHEHIHNILCKIFDIHVSSKFDKISHLLNKENNTKFQIIAHRNHLSTWQDVVEKNGRLDN